MAVPVDDEITPMTDDNGRPKAHPFKLTVGNWITLVTVIVGSFIGSVTWIDSRYCTKQEIKDAATIAELKQQLIDQNQHNEIAKQQTEVDALQDSLKVQGVVLVNIRENVGRVMKSLEDGEPRWAKKLPAGIQGKLDKYLAPTEDP
jgi:hypothetical protein